MLGKLYHKSKSHLSRLRPGERGDMKKNRLPKVTIRGKYFGERTLPSLNDYLAEIGKNPKAGNKFKQDYTKPLISSIRRCLRGYKVTNPPVILHYRFFESKKGKRRDVSNIFSLCAKFFEDALQITQTIENDNPDWIINFDTEFHWIDAKDEPYIEIEIEERGSNVTKRKNIEVFEDTQEGDNPADSV